MECMPIIINCKLNGVKSDIAPSTLTANLLTTESNTIFVEDSSVFTTFEGLAVSNLNPGYVKIGDEVISYQTASSNELKTLGRGIRRNSITRS